jgi:hypothetical protein
MAEKDTFPCLCKGAWPDLLRERDQAGKKKHHSDIFSCFFANYILN